jgi:hypothetical protein
MGPTLEDIVPKLEAKEGFELQKADIFARPVLPKLKEVKVNCEIIII